MSDEKERRPVGRGLAPDNNGLRMSSKWTSILRHNALFIAILALVLSAGCIKNPFSTRDSKPPAAGPVGTWETPQSPEVVIRNLLFSYNEMIISNFEACLGDTFTFSSPEDSIDAANSGRPDLFADWDRAAEVAVTTNIFATFAGSDSLDMFLTLTPAGADIIEDSTAILYRNYTIRIISGAGADTTMAKGRATFHLALERLNWWAINWWQDKPGVSGEYDWGDFKAVYRR